LFGPKSESESVRCSESGTKMPFLSASEDFLNSLNALPSIWNRLKYLASLRGDDGAPSHWGLARIHGQNAAEAAVCDGRRQVFAQILRRPLKELLQYGKM